MTTNIIPRRDTHTEPVRVKRIKEGLYRVCDLSGQGSQYFTPCELPTNVRKTVDAQGIAYASGLLRQDGRWSIGAAIACAETVNSTKRGLSQSNVATK